MAQESHLQYDGTELGRDSDYQVADEQRQEGGFRKLLGGKISSGAILAGVIVLALGLAWSTGFLDSNTEEISAITDLDDDDNAPNQFVEDPLEGLTPNPATVAGQVPGDGTTVPSLDGTPAPGQPNAQTAAQAREARRLAAEQARLAKMRAPVMVQKVEFQRQSSQNPASGPLSPVAGILAQSQNGAGALPQQTGLDAAIQTSTIRRIGAGQLTDRNFLVTAGTMIPCVMQTAIDTTQVGLVSCIVSRTVLSDNGNVVLLEKGTKVLGQYQGGIQQGQARLFISWNRAVTPKGVAINLASPAADPLGRSGLDGQTETFFWKRFGGSLLLSVLGDLSAIASNAVTDADETTNVPNRAAEVALQNTINIQPILTVSQGKEVTIFVANDLDFSTVYRLRLKR